MINYDVEVVSAVQDTECNPLHGPRVQEIIEKLEAGEEVDKQAYNQYE